MNCKDFEKLVPLYHDGELEGVKRSEFELHLSQCSECREALAKLEALDVLVRDGEAEKVPDPGDHYWQGFSKRIVHKLSEPRHLAARHSRPKLFGLRLIPYLSAGVAVIFGVIIGIELLQKTPGRFSQVERIEKLGEVKVKKDEGISRIDAYKPASPVSNERTLKREANFAEISTRSSESSLRALGEKDILATGSAKEEAEAISGFFSTEADMPAAADETVDKAASPEEEKTPQQENPASKEESITKPGVVTTILKQILASNDADKSTTTTTTTGRTENKDQTVKSTGGTTNAPSVATSEAQKAVSGGAAKSYPKGTIVFDRQFQPSGTLRVVVDSSGKLMDVTIYKSSGNASIDSQAIAAYKKQWSGQIYRQRQTTLYVPFSQSQDKTDNNK